MTMFHNLFTFLFTLSLQTQITNASFHHHKRRLAKNNNGDPKHGNYCTLTRHWHLSVGDDPSTSMIVSFSSHPKCAKSSAPVGAVLIGKEPNKADFVILEQNDARMYNATYPNKKKGSLYTSDYYHHVTVDGLDPNTRYYYRCVTVPSVLVDNIANEEMEDAERGLRQQHWDMTSTIAADLAERRRRYLKGGEDNDGAPSFVTAPAPGNDSRVKFVIMGDLGERTHSYETVAYLDAHREGINAILLVGDIAYTQNDHDIWDKWFDMLDATSFASEIPLQIATGNHDIEQDVETLDIFVAFENRFLMPQVQPAIIETMKGPIDKSLVDYPLPYDFGNAYYAFTYGPARHIVLSSYSNMDPGSKQYTWLVDQLNEVDRSVTPWLFVSLHCPIYNSFRLHRREPQLLHAKRFLEPLFVSHHVNIVFAGHVHAYMRTKPVIYDEVNDAGPIYVIVGNGGRQANAPYHRDEAEDWVLLRDHAEFGYGVLDIINSTHAFWEWEQTGFNAPEEAGKLGRYEPIEGQSDRGYVQNQFFLKK
mmetsp:Transcript_37849/g.55324  ORF Transcript_37849/g.55324 Transcript_37849/m.55324 type:complete len:533 (+) Transcript_37849:190-1788(+)